MEIQPGASISRSGCRCFGRPIRRAMSDLLTDPCQRRAGVVRGGGKMHVRMLCLGRHWNGKMATYEPVRSDYDEQPAPPLPKLLRALAREAPRRPAWRSRPIFSPRTTTQRRPHAVHQDKDERPIAPAADRWSRSSLGDTARFLFGACAGATRWTWCGSSPATPSSSVARRASAYHGVSRVLPNTAPAELALAGRINLTFRQYDVEGAK